MRPFAIAFSDSIIHVVMHREVSQMEEKVGKSFPWEVRPEIFNDAFSRVAATRALEGDAVGLPGESCTEYVVRRVGRANFNEQVSLTNQCRLLVISFCLYLIARSTLRLIIPLSFCVLPRCAQNPYFNTGGDVLKADFCRPWGISSILCLLSVGPRTMDL